MIHNPEHRIMSDDIDEQLLAKIEEFGRLNWQSSYAETLANDEVTARLSEQSAAVMSDIRELLKQRGAK